MSIPTWFYVTVCTLVDVFIRERYKLCEITTYEI